MKNARRLSLIVVFFVFSSVLSVLLVTSIAHAHKPSDSYLTLTIDKKTPTVVHGRWDIALRDLVNVIDDLDANRNGEITWAELAKRQDAIAAYAIGSDRLVIHGGPSRCNIVVDPKGHATATHSDGAYAVLQFDAQCTESLVNEALNIQYKLFFEVDAQHRGLLRLDAFGSSRTHVFSARAREQQFDLKEKGVGQQLGVIVKEGIIHIWKGYDHVLFLLALLLPAVLRRRNEDDAWEPVPRLRVALVDVLRIVTAFTIAHSITLSLAALGVVTLPSRLVESAIAASVVLAAVNNIKPILREDRWLAAFMLGLMHGFGFSSTLMDLDLPRENLVITLFGFNLGVEIGQVAIVCVFVPLAYRIRTNAIYTRGILRLGSVAIALLAMIWLIERAFVVKILPG